LASRLGNTAQFLTGTDEPTYVSATDQILIPNLSNSSCLSQCKLVERQQRHQPASRERKETTTTTSSSSVQRAGAAAADSAAQQAPAVPTLGFTNEQLETLTQQTAVLRKLKLQRVGAEQVTPQNVAACKPKPLLQSLNVAEPRATAAQEAAAATAPLRGTQQGTQLAQLDNTMQRCGAHQQHPETGSGEAAAPSPTLQTGQRAQQQLRQHELYLLLAPLLLECAAGVEEPLMTVSNHDAHFTAVKSAVIPYSAL
jgi:hypothetical protein